VAVLTFRRNYASVHDDGYERVKAFFVRYTLLYIFLSFLITGVSVHPPEQYLYIVNFAVILFMLPKAKGDFEVYENKPKAWLKATGIVILIISILALIAINSHEEIPGSNIRFEVSEKRPGN
jgi:hypothetical protein